MSNLNNRALVVDDEPLIRNLTMRALSHEGFVCDCAADGDEALVRIGATKYDVVITDLRMPNMNGHALSVELLNNVNGRPLIVVLTGVAEPKLAKDLLSRGVDDIVYKPVDYKLLATKVRSLANRSTKDTIPQQSKIDLSSSANSKPKPLSSSESIEEKKSLDHPKQKIVAVDLTKFKIDFKQLVSGLPQPIHF